MDKTRYWLIEKRGDKSQKEVAKLVGIDRSFYSQIENGTRNPSVNTAIKIGAVLNFDWTIFFSSGCGVKHQKMIG